jgi:hypothetical protein
MNAKRTFIGATRIPTSNPFGNARLRSSKHSSDLVVVLRDRARAVVARARAALTIRM